MLEYDSYKGLTMTLSLEDCIALEQQVWNAMLNGDPEADKRALTENFLGVYETGFSDRETHCKAMAHGPIAKSYTISEARLLGLSEEIVILSYLATWVPIRNGNAQQEEVMYISSVWQKSGDSWLNVFSQDTPKKTASHI